jgi:hypothetical protein
MELIGLKPMLFLELFIILIMDVQVIEMDSLQKFLGQDGTGTYPAPNRFTPPLPLPEASDDDQLHKLLIAVIILLHTKI